MAVRAEVMTEAQAVPRTEAIRWRLARLIEEYGDNALGPTSVGDLTEWLTAEREGWPSIEAEARSLVPAQDDLAALQEALVAAFDRWMVSDNHPDFRGIIPEIFDAYRAASPAPSASGDLRGQLLAIPLGAGGTTGAGWNRYDTDDELVLHLWSGTWEPGGQSWDIRVSKGAALSASTPPTGAEE